VGEVAGVLSADPASGIAGELIPEITPDTLPDLAQVLGGSRGVDVTGGMVAKVREMLDLLQVTPALAAVQIVSGLTPELVRSVLVDPDLCAGTRVSKAAPKR
jgi:isopentenyl phosphate kinase